MVHTGRLNITPSLCSCDDLSSDMCLHGLAVQSLHGDREQYDREEALKDFKEGEPQKRKCLALNGAYILCTAYARQVFIVQTDSSDKYVSCHPGLDNGWMNFQLQYMKANR